MGRRSWGTLHVGRQDEGTSVSTGLAVPGQESVEGVSAAEASKRLDKFSDPIRSDTSGTLTGWEFRNPGENGRFGRPISLPTAPVGSL